MVFLILFILAFVSFKKFLSKSSKNILLTASNNSSFSKKFKPVIFLKKISLSILSNEGVQLGQAIVLNNVYLGKISEVNLFSSKAMIITDLNCRVPVVIPSRGVNAILKGNGLAGAQLLFLPQNAVLENNDQIYTSGSDGIIKEGLYIGKIITDNKKDIKKRKYSVDLGFKEHQLNYVSVLKVKK